MLVFIFLKLLLFSKNDNSCYSYSLELKQVANNYYLIARHGTEQLGLVYSCLFRFVVTKFCFPFLLRAHNSLSTDLSYSSFWC